MQKLPLLISIIIFLLSSLNIKAQNSVELGNPDKIGANFGLNGFIVDIDDDSYSIVTSAFPLKSKLMRFTREHEVLFDSTIGLPRHLNVKNKRSILGDFSTNTGKYLWINSKHKKGETFTINVRKKSGDGYDPVKTIYSYQLEKKIQAIQAIHGYNNATSPTLPKDFSISPDSSKVCFVTELGRRNLSKDWKSEALLFTVFDAGLNLLWEQKIMLKEDYISTLNFKVDNSGKCYLTGGAKRVYGGVKVDNDFHVITANSEGYSNNYLTFEDIDVFNLHISIPKNKKERYRLFGIFKNDNLENGYCVSEVDFDEKNINESSFSIHKLPQNIKAEYDDWIHSEIVKMRIIDIVEFENGNILPVTESMFTEVKHNFEKNNSESTAQTSDFLLPLFSSDLKLLKVEFIRKYFATGHFGKGVFQIPISAVSFLHDDKLHLVYNTAKVKSKKKGKIKYTSKDVMSKVAVCNSNGEVIKNQIVLSKSENKKLMIMHLVKRYKNELFFVGRWGYKNYVVGTMQL